MSTIEKLKQELKRRPKTFEWREAKRILEHEGYLEDTSGKTSGSRVRFENDEGLSFVVHKPHSDSKMKSYAIRDLASFLEQEGKL